MDEPVRFTVYLRPYDPDITKPQQRIAKVMAGDKEVRCQVVTLDFAPDGLGSLGLRIPMRMVDVVFVTDEEQ